MRPSDEVIVSVVFSSRVCTFSKDVEICPPHLTHIQLSFDPSCPEETEGSSSSAVPGNRWGIEWLFCSYWPCSKNWLDILICSCRPRPEALSWTPRCSQILDLEWSTDTQSKISDKQWFSTTLLGKNPISLNRCKKINTTQFWSESALKGIWAYFPPSGITQLSVDQNRPGFHNDWV